MSSESTELDQIYYVGGVGEGNFSTIKEAIFQASNNSKIIVYPGTYNESIDLYKKIHLESKYAHKAIIRFIGSDDVISITSNECSIIGFNISSQTIDSYTGMTIFSNENTVKNNIFFKNNGKGLYLYRTQKNIIENNIFIDDGVFIVGDLIEWVSQKILNNTVNNKSLIFIKNKKDYTIESSNIGQLILANCSNSKIYKCIINGSDYGLLIGHSHYCSIYKNDFYQNGQGIHLSNSNNLSIHENTVHNNENGIYIIHSNNNQLFLNYIENNSIIGCRICCGSKFNTVFQNNFIRNNKSSFDSNNNTWFKKNIGNYWSQYGGVDNDNDGIGDSPYKIPGNSTIDKFPLMLPTSKLIQYDKKNDNLNEMPFISCSYLLILFVILSLLKVK